MPIRVLDRGLGQSLKFQPFGAYRAPYEYETVSLRVVFPDMEWGFATSYAVAAEDGRLSCAFSSHRAQRPRKFLWRFECPLWPSSAFCLLSL